MTLLLRKYPYFLTLKINERRTECWDSAGAGRLRNAIFKPHKSPATVVHRDEKHYPCSGILGQIVQSV